MLSALISDVSANLLVQFPRELGDSIMGGMTAAEFNEFKQDCDQQEELMKELFHNLSFKVSSLH
jgi:hypothetical protein